MSSDEYVDSVFLHMDLRLIERPQSLIRSKVIIVVFQDNVSKEKIDKYIADVIANGKDISFGLNLEIWYIYVLTLLIA